MGGYSWRRRDQLVAHLRMKVAPDFITFYVDGQEVGRKPTNLEYLNDPLYIIINYALRDPLTGEPFASKGRSSLQVDWVRAYSLPSNISIPPPQMNISPKFGLKTLVTIGSSKARKLQQHR